MAESEAEWVRLIDLDLDADALALALAEAPFDLDSHAGFCCAVGKRRDRGHDFAPALEAVPCYAVGSLNQQLDLLLWRFFKRFA